jgi:hypothetical protein
MAAPAPPAQVIADAHEFAHRRADWRNLARILAYGELAFDWIEQQLVPPPSDIDPRDFGDVMTELLGLIAAKHPDKLEAKLKSRTHWGSKFRYICAARVAGTPRLLELVIDGLDERSPHLKDLVLSFIQSDARLRTPAAAAKIRRLLRLRTADKLSLSREQLERLAIEIETPAISSTAPRDES